MGCRRGPKARAVVERAIDLVKVLPKPLQEAQAHAILSVLSEPMLAFLQERSMDVSKIPLNKAQRQFKLFFENRGKAEGKAEGKREALLAFLAARRLEVTEEERTRIAACTSPAELDRWIKRAATATSVLEVLDVKPTKTARRAPPKARTRASSSRAGRRPSAG